jgi:hypothetical protein
MSTTVEMLDQVAEGTISLADTSVWLCVEHEVRVKVGKDCLFCLSDEVGDEIFS